MNKTNDIVPHGAKEKEPCDTRITVRTVMLIPEVFPQRQ